MPAPYRHHALAVAIAGALLPSLAGAATDGIDDIIVTAPRRVLPDLWEEQLFNRQELDRLAKIVLPPETRRAPSRWVTLMEGIEEARNWSNRMKQPKPQQLRESFRDTSPETGNY